MADRNGYIGRGILEIPPLLLQGRFLIQLPQQQTLRFSAGYTVGYLDLYLNGTRLIEGQDFTASDTSTIILLSAAINGDVLEAVAYKAFNLANDKVGIQSSGVLIGNASQLNFVGTGNTFAVNGSTIDVSISSGAASIMTIGVRVGTAVTFSIPSTNVIGVVGRSGTVNVPV